MENKSILETIDSDLAEKVMSRRDALFGAGMFRRGLAAASAPVALAVSAKSVFGQTAPLPQGIINVLNFALTLEELEAEFYRLGLATTGLVRPQFLPVFQSISAHETAHVALLRSALGSAAVAKPTFNFRSGAFGDIFRDFGVFSDVAQLFEDTGVRAYKGQAAALISNNAILTTALQIHSVEARHAAAVRMIRGQKPVVGAATTEIGGGNAVYAGEDLTVQFGVNVPVVANVPAYSAHEAFDEPLTMAQVLDIVRPFIVA